jgi:23S rRNA pseudouridine2605 synthase
MTDTPVHSGPERVAKIIARSGVASRRDAEKMILEGRVAVNGKTIDTPALDVLPKDKVTIDGKPIDAPQETRLWLYYKPLGLVTTEKDDQGRRTIFDEMPEGMPRVLNVGRLDLNSEGLLLLTNDGGLKRRLEHPETAWLRKYRVRVNGRPSNDTFNPLREGITIDGEDFQPMEVTLDRQQGANAWLTVGIREGKNREIRRAMNAINLTVNRLIRVSYGPFRLNDMQPGDVTEVKRKVLRDQLGDRLLSGIEDGAREAPGPARARPAPRRGRPPQRLRPAARFRGRRRAPGALRRFPLASRRRRAARGAPVRQEAVRGAGWRTVLRPEAL